MGPSGAGKDTLLRAARRLVADEKIAFAHRYISRPLVPGDEEFVPLTPSEFAARRDAGFFAMHWRAHEVAYGIGVEVDFWLHAGWSVVVSGSREHYNAQLVGHEDVFPFIVTAPPQVLADRLASRRREDAPGRSARLARRIAVDKSCRPLTIIDNSGAIEHAALTLMTQLRTLAGDIAPRS
jgi:ribose 1,5-bisphosphokinase